MNEHIKISIALTKGRVKILELTNIWKKATTTNKHRQD